MTNFLLNVASTVVGVFVVILIIGAHEQISRRKK